ncbi:3-hydroxyisobutyrate dehydrogenase, mitochondrial [Chionoecetes opilio]|uniref:3-hydroxyisobutyrate dehydrogenase n=1 Tax=Chionoecetes opilio TaxID=41210 RepID=A0A8J5D4E4_CHIOP|nr:3-hydroxyisobutyrate dehydrogenase, mitochondrial [Chionoecetes opilio]
MALLRSTITSLHTASRNAFTLNSIRSLSVGQPRHKPSTNVGFIGLGNMGGPMAVNLLNKGHSIVVYDVSSEAVKRLEDEGAVAAASPSEVASKVDRIISMLPNSQHVRSCYGGDKGVFQSIRPGTLILDSSTIDPSVSKEMASLASKKGAVFMDAPVSGGVNAAAGATLTFMVGGEEKEFVAAKELLSVMGKNIVYCGEVGNGQAVKICNNMLLAITMIGTAETMNLGMRLGLEPKLMASIINTASGRCWASEVYNPVPGVLENVPASNDYQGGFGTALMTKDLGLVQGAATATHSPTPMGSLAHQIYRMMCNSGLAEKDFSSVYQFLQENNNNK